MTTHPGSYTPFPAAFRLCCHNVFMASPPSWTASEEPVVAVPMAPLADEACQRLARIETQRVWIFSDLNITHQQETGYLTIWTYEWPDIHQNLTRNICENSIYIWIKRRLPVRFLEIFSRKSSSAWGGIHVCTKEARFRIGEPSFERS